MPRAGVVARVVAGAAQRERRERRARAGVAVRDDLGAFRRADELADPLGRLRHARRREERLDLDVPRARDVPLPRVARAAALARVLLVAADVEDRQRRDRRAGRRARRASAAHAWSATRSASRTGSSSNGPVSSSPSQPAIPPSRIATFWMAGELGELRGRHRADAVAAVDEHEPLAARDAVPAQAQHDLLRELLHRSPRPRPAAASRARAAASRGCARACARSGRARRRRRDRRRRDAPRARRRRRPAGELRHRAATIPCLGRDRGTLEQPREPVAQRRIRVEVDAEQVARAQDPRDVRDVGEPVLRAAEPRLHLEHARRAARAARRTARRAARRRAAARSTAS